MKKLTKNLKRAFVILSAISFVMLIECTTKSPVEPDEGLGDISISLVKTGVTQTNFYGTDINLIVDFSDTIVCTFDTIKIHSTDARFYIPDESITGQKVIQVVIPLYWISKAKLRKDSVSGFYYDNVYVQSGLTKSNIVKVVVLNLPPFIDSLVVGDTAYKVFHRLQNLNFFVYYLKDSLKNRDLPLKAFARDLDGSNTELRFSWGNTGEDKYLVAGATQATLHLATYKARKESFRDTIQLNVYDSSATLNVKINLVQLDGSEIALDSITFRDNINDTTFRDTAASKYIIKKIVFNDTATIRAFPHKSGGTASFSATRGKVIQNTALDPNGFAITYVCTLSTVSDTVTTDMVMFVDSIKCIHKNNYGDDSIVKTIVLLKKPSNRNPVIDSVFIDSKMCKTAFKDTVAAGRAIPLKAYAHDPEGGTITFLWQGNLNGTLYTATGDSNTYTAANATYIDTLILFAADSLGFKDTQSIILISNKPPVIDSILIDTVRYKSGFVHVVSASDTIALRGWAHDPEALIGSGTIKYSWQAQGTLTGSLTSTIGASVSYIAKNGTYADSIYLIAADSLGLLDIQLISLPCNNTPLIDSIRVGAKVFFVKLTDSIYDTILAPDTFTVKPKAYDIDSTFLNDIISYSWRYKNQSLQVTTSTADSIVYMSASQAYLDTVSITITDKFKAKKVKKIFLKFTQ